MVTNNTTPAVVSALQAALSNALANLPDVVGDPAAANIVPECSADIAALSHLVAPDATGNPRIAAYL